MFRVVTPPIIRRTYSCNYSIWHWSNRLCYLPLLCWRSWNWFIIIYLKLIYFIYHRKCIELRVLQNGTKVIWYYRQHVKRRMSSAFCDTAYWLFMDACVRRLCIRVTQMRIGNDIQGGPKVGIQYVVYIYILLYTHFWPTLYKVIYCKNRVPWH